MKYILIGFTILSVSACTMLDNLVVPSPSPSVIVTTPSPTPSPTTEAFSNGWKDGYVAFIRDNVSSALLSTTATDYCTGYAKLSDKKAFWVSLFKWDSYYESGWNYTNQYIESTLGLDPITRLPVKSEGLMQLSYQDAANYKTPDCLKMDWNKDKALPLSARTIVNPYINLGCALEIMTRLVTKYPSLPLNGSLGKYWSTLRTDGKMSAIASHIAQEVAGCGK